MATIQHATIIKQGGQKATISEENNLSINSIWINLDSTKRPEVLAQIKDMKSLLTVVENNLDKLIGSK